MGKRIYTSVIFILLVISSIQIQAQNNYWDEFVIKKLQPKRADSEIPKNDDSRKPGDMVYNNIKGHQQEVINLRMQGKSESEVNKILSLRIKTSGTGSISGRIYKSDGFTPVFEYMSVYCYDEYGQYSGYGYTLTFDSTYTIYNLAGGRYYVRTYANQNYKNEYYDNAETWETATLVTVTDGQMTSGINFSLDEFSGSISGYVKNNAGEPLIADVSASEIDFDGYGYTQTDTNGFYTIQKLGSGDYKVYAYYNGDLNYAGEYYNNAADYESASLVRVNEPSVTPNIDFFLDYAGAISGQVFNPEGQPVGSYYANIVLVDFSNNYLSQSQTDSAGKYFFKGIPPGKYKLSLTLNGPENLLNCWYGDAFSFEYAASVEVNPPDTLKNIDFHLKPGGAISGKVSSNGQPIWGLNIIAYNENSDGVSSGYVSDGNYIINKLRPGNYKLRTQANDLVNQWYNNKDDYNSADFVEVKGTDTTTNIDFVLDRGGVIGGNVTINGQPLMDGRILVYDLNKNLVEDGYVYGSYNITGLKLGPYKLFYSYDGIENYADQWYNDKNDFESADTVYATPQLYILTNFNIKNGGGMQGFVVDDNERRINGEEKMKQVLLYDAINGENLKSKNLSFTGGYRLSSPYGSYKIAVVDFYLNGIHVQDSLSVSYYGGGLSFNDPLTQSVNISSPVPRTLNDIKMEKSPGSISGSVFNKTELLTNGAYEILAYDEYGYIVKVVLYFETMDGKYIICGLRPGKYYLLAGASAGGDSVLIQWYDGLKFLADNLSPKIIIPDEAKAVVIGESETAGIDFYFDFITDTREDNTNMVYSFGLEQNYPNPFNPSTTINYSVSKNSFVSIIIYDALGREVKTLINQEKTAGNYKITWNAASLPSGVYFYQIRADKYVHTKKMILMK